MCCVANTLTGAGVTVGVLSDSYNCYAVYAANNVPAAGAAGYAHNGFLATAATDVVDRRSAVQASMCSRRPMPETAAA